MTDNPVSSYNLNQENAYNKKRSPRLILQSLVKTDVHILLYVYGVCCLADVFRINPKIH